VEVADDFWAGSTPAPTSTPDGSSLSFRRPPYTGTPSITL